MKATFALRSATTALVALPLFVASAQACIPFAGEEMHFTVGWEFVPAGMAHMRVTREGARYRIVTHARTNKFFDLFKKVRDTIVSEGVCVGSLMQSEWFDLEQQEVRYRSHKTAKFYWREGKVEYIQNGKSDFYEVPAGHLDVLDAFFKVRTLPLRVGDRIHLPVFDQRKRYSVVVHVLGKDRLKAPWGEWVDCLVIQPRLETAGIFSSKGEIKIWLTDDARHIPLKMTAKIKIGHIVARLKTYQAS